MDEMICVGVLGGAFGVNGEVRLKSYTADPEAIADYAPLTSEDGSRSFDIQITRPLKGGFAARLSNVRTKEEADALKGLQLFAPRDRLPDLQDDEFYYTDLIGLTVLDTGGAEIGKVKAVLNHGASDLLELIVPGASTTVLLPFTRAVVPTVDIASGRIIADPPEGLLE
ncbi:ribosome maturation factor RimM [Alloyangia pacifica]|uniref:Ribosome maturation factor RimM n=1 Tax=Alloyangia pacifica TaxID=311180 RepID=A0A1I6V8I0_9RHOB|nr:ribosome maturation factor RimM [Alloyangia pacifica]SDH89616.1 16S rRNA processing protein RimM [Alloyangia pacifica]SFT10011.1 16S rRNA processing protein RimM [Alloyangia pacifica]